MMSPAMLGCEPLPGDELPEGRFDPESILGKLPPPTSENMIFGSIVTVFEAQQRRMFAVTQRDGERNAGPFYLYPFRRANMEYTHA